MFLRQIISSTKRVAPNLRAMSSKGPLVDLTVDNDGVSILTLQRAPVNSLNLDLLKEFNEKLDEVAKNKSKGLVITSASPTVFSAGLDIMEMYKPDLKRVEEFWRTLQDMYAKLFVSKYPTAAAINGHAPAGGCLISMTTEYRVMVKGKYTIGLNETALGIVAPNWFIDTMTHTIPTRQAELALTTAKLFTIDEALKGHAPAGGCLISMTTEYRVMVQGKYTIGLNESALGIVATSWFRDTMTHTIPTRQAEIALTAAKLFTVDEALKVGLIDEVATDKADAVNKCKGFIKKFDRIPPLARSITKQKVRQDIYNRFKEGREKDLQEFLGFVQSPQVQQSLEMYIQALKKKSASAN